MTSTVLRYTGAGAGGHGGPRRWRGLLAGVAVLVVSLLAACTSNSSTGGRPATSGKVVHFGKTSVGPGWSTYDSGPYSTELNAQRPDLAYVRDHRLFLTSKGNAGSGVCLCKPGAKSTKPYGRWDVRARVSAGAGDHGYAILLWPNAENWPVGGEIDFAEFPDADRRRLQTSVHFGTDNSQHTHFTAGYFTQWHTYGVIWKPTYIDFLLDGKVVYKVTDPAAIPHHAMHLALQAGVAQGVTDPQDDGTATLEVAWVKINQS